MVASLRPAAAFIYTPIMENITYPNAQKLSIMPSKAFDENKQETAVANTTMTTSSVGTGAQICIPSTDSFVTFPSQNSRIASYNSFGSTGDSSFRRFLRSLPPSEEVVGNDGVPIGLRRLEDRRMRSTSSDFVESLLAVESQTRVARVGSEPTTLSHLTQGPTSQDFFHEPSSLYKLNQEYSNIHSPKSMTRPSSLETDLSAIESRSASNQAFGRLFAIANQGRTTSMGSTATSHTDIMPMSIRSEFYHSDNSNAQLARVQMEQQAKDSMSYLTNQVLQQGIPSTVEIPIHPQTDTPDSGTPVLTKTSKAKKQKIEGTIKGAANKKKTQRKHRAAPKPEVRTYVDTLLATDVLFGRGGLTKKTNRRYYNEVYNMRDEYRSSTKQEKTVLAQKLVDYVHSYGGRFLKKDAESSQDRWYVASNLEARTKAARALNEHMTMQERKASKK